MPKPDSIHDIQLSARAARRICEIARKTGAAPLLRLSVGGGGCSGFQYDFALAERAQDDDLVVECEGARLIVDPVSLPFVKGARLDYAEELIGAFFRVENPNASASCGCGTSFSV